MKNLTKKEEQIMEILWGSEEALSARDIQNQSNDLSIFTVQQVLQRLLKYEYVEVSDYGTSHNSSTRLYSPLINESEYISRSLSENTVSGMALSFVDRNGSLEDLDTLSRLIDERVKELKKR